VTTTRAIATTRSIDALTWAFAALAAATVLLFSAHVAHAQAPAAKMAALPAGVNVFTISTFK